MRPDHGSARDAEESGWNHNFHYHPLILGLVPARCLRALDVGCGEGLLTRRLATCCGEVIGIDRDESVHAALLEGQELEGSVCFVAGDVMSYPFAAAGFDFIAVVATLHHLRLAEGLARLRDLLRPGGVLAVVGLYRPRSLGDYAVAAAALPVSWILRHVRGSANMRAPMQRPEATLKDIRQAAKALLPGAALKRRFFFRYSLVWSKPV